MNKADEIYDYIRGEIVNEKLCIHEKLNVGKIGEKFGVSKVIVKTALKKLEYQGWLYTTPKSGTYVAPLESEELKQSFQVRMILEPNILLMSIPFIKDEDVAQLKENCQKMEDPSLDQREFLSIETANHRIVENRCQNKLLVRMVGELVDSYSRLGMITRDPSRRGASTYEWKMIIAAIEERDSEQARLCMIRHIMNATEAFWKNVITNVKKVDIGSKEE